MIEDAALDRLVHFQPQEAPVLSLYVTFRRAMGLHGMKALLHSLLQPVQELADSQALSHAGRVSLRADLARLHQIVEPLDLAWKGEEKELNRRARHGRHDELPDQRQALLGRTVALFACHHAGLYEQCELRRPVPDRAEVDLTPYLRPLLAVMEEAHAGVVAVIDAKNAWLFTYADGELHEEDILHATLLDKRKRASWHGLAHRRHGGM
jgi:peptide chain release factor subunit 1